MTEMPNVPSSEGPVTFHMKDEPLKKQQVLEQDQDLYTQKYKQRFKEVLQPERQTGIFSKLSKVFSSPTPPPPFPLPGDPRRSFSPTRRDSLAYAVQMSVEHMSEGDLWGNPVIYANHRTRELLNTMKLNLPSSSQELDHLEDLLWVADAITTSPSPAELAKAYVSSLEVGKSTAISLTTSRGNVSHRIIMVFTCTSNKDGKKTYDIELHNTGNGLQYHHQKVDKNGKPLYQTVMKVVGIPGEKLYSDTSFFLANWMDRREYQGTGSIENLYEMVIHSLGGRIEEPSQNPALWGNEQLGGSCTAGCFSSLIKSRLRPEEWRAFGEAIRYELLFRTFSHIKNGTDNENAEIRKIVALEMIKEIQHLRGERGLPEELQVLQARLIKTPPKSGPVKQESTRPGTPGQAILTPLNLAFAILDRKDRIRSHEDLFELEGHLAKVLNMLQTEWIMSPQEREQLIETAKRVLLFCDSPLTSEELYFMAPMLFLINKAMIHEGMQDDFEVSVEQCFGKIYHKYEELELDLRYGKIYPNTLLKTKQKHSL